ncbi:MAG TPA: Stp1/IreP family PP2C-type Ser/Thr phosphatase [Solirubrobacteraceae bacterium]|nr:Stp1/IreP family PP2C-type Ser/Thr phosphatase [Solirubrobacteraceae bacterium]
MLRVAEQYAGTDTGRQRRANEDSMLARSPLFVVADGMGGAQAGEVASRIAVESFEAGVADTGHPEAALAALAQQANARIYELSHSNAEQAGMGTTLTAVYVGEREIAIAHVGDSRAYRVRDGELLRLTEDHSLVDELLRQGRLTPEEAVEHPQRSVITRALGPEGAVEVDTRSYAARDGDVYLLCSDGLTTMLAEAQLASIVNAHATLRDAGEALIAAANEAGGRDNITVVLLRVEQLDVGTAPLTEEAPAAQLPPLDKAPRLPTAETPAADATGAAAMPGASVIVTAPPQTQAPATPGAAEVPVARRHPRRAPRRQEGRRRRFRVRRVAGLGVTLAILALLAGGAYLGIQSVYFIGTNEAGLVTVFRGVPFTLPGGLALYETEYVSGVGAATLSPSRRHSLLDHSLRSEGDTSSLMHSLELGELE